MPTETPLSAGIHAYSQERPISDNPFQPGEDGHDEWKEGWLRGRDGDLAPKPRPGE